MIAANILIMVLICTCAMLVLIIKRMEAEYQRLMRDNRILSDKLAEITAETLKERTARHDAGVKGWRTRRENVKGGRHE